MKSARVEKTKEDIREETLRLLRKNTLQGVTVKDITSNLGLSRSTFYLHYENVSDVIDDVENIIISDLSRIIFKHSSGNYLEGLYETGNYLKDNATKIQTVVDVSQSHFTYKIKKTFEPIVVQTIAPHLRGDEKTKKYIGIFLFSAGVGVFRAWCDSGYEVPIEDLIKTFVINFSSLIKE